MYSKTRKCLVSLSFIFTNPPGGFIFMKNKIKIGTYVFPDVTPAIIGGCMFSTDIYRKFPRNDR